MLDGFNFILTHQECGDQIGGVLVASRRGILESTPEIRARPQLHAQEGNLLLEEHLIG